MSLQQSEQEKKNMSPSHSLPLILADENIKKKLVKYFSLKGYDICYAEKGLKNSFLINFAKQKKRVLLTHDHDFLNDSIYPPENYDGIIVVDIHPPSLDKQIYSLEKLLSAHTPDEFIGKLFIVGEEGEIEKE